MRRRLRRALFPWLLLSCAPLAILAAQQSAVASWPVEYVGGSELIALETKLNLRVTPTGIVLEGSDGRGFTIPPQAVKIILHENEPNWAKRELQSGTTGGAAFGPGGALFEAGRALFLLAASRNSHIVTVAWGEPGEHGAAFRVGKQHYQELLAELERATGQPPRNPQKEWEAAFKKRVPVKLDRDVWLKGRRLRAGTHRVTLFPDFYGRWELIWSPLPAKFWPHVGGRIGPVEVEPASGAGKEASVEYARTGPPWTIAAIRFPDKIVRLHKGPHLIPGQLLREQHGIVFLQYPYKDWEARIRLEGHEGELALKFPARHRHGGSTEFPCNGVVFVTATRVGYVTTVARHSFNLSRAAVQEAKFSKIKTKDGTYRFVPLLTRQDERSTRDEFRGIFDELFYLAYEHFDRLLAEFRQARPN